MKLFRCIVNDGKEIFEAYSAGKTKKEMLNIYGGNGEFEKIEDVTKDYLTDSSVEKLEDTLRLNGWGKGEIALITALVHEHVQNKK